MSKAWENWASTRGHPHRVADGGVNFLVQFPCAKRASIASKASLILRMYGSL